MSSSSPNLRLRAPARRTRAATAVAAALGVLAAAAVATPAAAAVAAAPAGVTRVVSLSGTIDSSCGSGIPGGTPVHTSIQSAVNAAAVGSTIYVCAGTYTENVNVNKDGIDLVGPNWNDPAQGSDAATIVAATAGSPAVQFTGTTNTDSGFRGFTVDGGTYGVLVAASDGCCWDGATEGIRNNTFTDQTTASIRTNGLNGPGSISGNVVAPAAGADGIVVIDAAGNLAVTNNQITLTGTSGTGIAMGTQPIAGAGIANVGNTVTNNQVTGGAIGVHVYGQPNETAFEQWAETISVSSNTLVDQSANGVKVSGAALNIDVLDNTITSPGGSGVLVAGPSTGAFHDIEATEVLRNTITGAGRDGVEVTGHVLIVDVGNTATNGNTITDPARHGISVIGFLEGASTAVVTRDFSIDDVRTQGNTISGAGCDGVHIENVDFAEVWNEDISGSGCNGVTGTKVDWIDVRNSTITASTGDGVRYSNAFDGWVFDNVITQSGGDGVELADQTGSIVVTLSDVNQNAAGVRVTSPTVPELNLIDNNNLAQNTGYACEDQSSGPIANPPAAGTQGNDWTTTNVGAALQSPNGICGATLTATGPLPDGVVGSSFSAPMTASGAPGPYTWTSTALPAGLTLNPSTGVVSGTPTTPVTNVPVTFWVSSPSGLWGQFTDPITIVPALTATGTLPDGTVGQAYSSAAPTAAGGVGPYTWSATGLPAGLSIDPSTGVVSGTPTVAVVDASITRTVTDSGGRTATITETITLLPPDPGIPLAHPAALSVAGALGLAVAGLRFRRRHAFGA